MYHSITYENTCICEIYIYVKYVGVRKYLQYIENSSPKLEWLCGSVIPAESWENARRRDENKQSVRTSWYFFLTMKIILSTNSYFTVQLRRLRNWRNISQPFYRYTLYCVEKQLFLRTICSKLKIWWTTGFSITVQPAWKLLIDSNNVLLCLDSIDRRSWIMDNSSIRVHVTRRKPLLARIVGMWDDNLWKHVW